MDPDSITRQRFEGIDAGRADHSAIVKSLSVIVKIIYTKPWPVSPALLRRVCRRLGFGRRRAPARKPLNITSATKFGVIRSLPRWRRGGDIETIS